MADVLQNAELISAKSSPSKEFKSFIARLGRLEDELVEIQDSFASLQVGAPPHVSKAAAQMEQVARQIIETVNDLWKELSNSE